MAAERKINGKTFLQWLDEVIRCYLIDFGEISFPIDKSFPFREQWEMGYSPSETSWDYHYFLYPEELGINPDPYGYDFCDEW